MARALEAGRSDLTFEGGELGGPGAAVVGQAIADARFVLLGEDHGIAEIPRLATALYRALQPAGFDTLAIEAGPRVVSEIERLLGMDERRARLEAFLAEYPHALAFYDLEEELAFLERAAALSGARFRLVGFDQELAGAGKFLLRQAHALARTPESRARLDLLLAAEAEAYRRALATGDPGRLFLMAGDRVEVEGLRDALARESPAAALPLGALLTSRAIYEEDAAEAYRANLERARLMKEQLAAAVGDRWPKLLVKVGAYHAYKGLNPLRSRELGSFLAEIAELLGSRSLHLLVVAAGGEQARISGVGRPPETAPIDLAGAGAEMPPLAPLIEIARRHERASLFDLRPLRPRYRELGPWDPELERLVFGYDLLVLIPRGTPSRPAGAPPPQ